jgi:4a-hydroxytetrahydrobiopterin dehydratase
MKNALSSQEAAAKQEKPMTQPICNLATKNCKPCTEGLAALDQNEIDRLLQTLNGWEQRGHELVKTYPFKNYYETMAFVNATAWISHQEDHHPELEVGYRQCCVHYSTHVIGGLSENDFICAAKLDALQASNGS